MLEMNWTSAKLLQVELGWMELNGFTHIRCGLDKSGRVNLHRGQVGVTQLLLKTGWIRVGFDPTCLHNVAFAIQVLT